MKITAIKHQFFLLFLLINCISCENLVINKFSGNFIKTQQKAKAYEADIYKIFENSSPEVKKISTEFVTLFLNNSEDEFIQKSGKGKDYLRKVTNNINFFIAKIDEARAFKPRPDHIALYDKLKGKLQADKEVIIKYINDNNPNFNQTDNQRRRIFQAILDNDFYGYQNTAIFTKKEFEKNFKFLDSNWEDLLLEMYMYFGAKSLNQDNESSY